MWVTASKDFCYDDVVGDVKTGQLFELRGQPNDGGLLKHRLVLPVEPQPDKEALKHYPQCGECGRRFLEPWQRERCGRMHELSAAELRAARREETGKRLDKLRDAGELS